MHAISGLYLQQQKMMVFKKQSFEGDGAEIASSAPLDIGSLASVGTDFLVPDHLNHPLVRMASFKLVISCLVCPVLCYAYGFLDPTFSLHPLALGHLFLLPPEIYGKLFDELGVPPCS